MIQPTEELGDYAAMSSVEPLEVDAESAQRPVRGKMYESIADDDDDWIGPGNLDEFFSSVYAYYYEKGFACIATKVVVNNVTLGFTILFSTFLIGFVDWEELMTCKDEATCKEFGHYVVGLGSHQSLAFRAFVSLYFILFSGYWMWTMSLSVSNVRRSWEMRNFFLKRLCITTRELQTMEWYQIVDKMIQLQVRGDYPIQLNGSGFDAKDIAMRIMRKKNYMIAIVNEEVIPIGTAMFGSRWFFGMNLEMMLEVCLLDAMFDTQFKVRQRFLRDVTGLKNRFRLFGVINLLLMPFSIGFMVIYSFLKYAEEWHSKRNYLGPRWWSPFALWKFREFNELEHIFEKRTIASVKHADDYLRQFPSPVPTVVAGGVSFVTGGFVGILMLLTLLDDSILLHIKLDDRNLVWYIAIFSGILAISRGFIPPLEQSVFSPEKAMRKVVAFTHFLPDNWRDATHTFDVRDSFGDYLPYKVLLLLRELFCIITAPYVLIVVFPAYAQELLDFVRSRTEAVEGLGDVCTYSKLDLAVNGDKRYGADLKSNLGGEYVNIHRNTLSGGKLEKSWLSFKLNYPTWQDSQNIGCGENTEVQRRNLATKLTLFQRDVIEDSLTNSAPVSSSSFDAMAASFTAASDIERRHRNSPMRLVSNLPSSHADHEYFSASDTIVQPLGTFKYPNSENYFYWLEEYRDRAGGTQLNPMGNDV